MQDSGRIGGGAAAANANAPPSSSDTQANPASPLIIVDGLGHRHRGSVLVMARWPGSESLTAPPEQEEFRIIILRQPPPEPVRPPRGVAVCIPAQPLKRPTAVREPPATYRVQGRRQSLPRITTADLRLLAQGEVVAATQLTVKPEEVFREGKAQLDLLARDLLTSQGLADYLEPLNAVLSAPAPRPPGTYQETVQRLASLLQAVAASAQGEGEAAPPEAGEAVRRLSQVVEAAEPAALLTTLRRLYPQVRALLEDVYLLRALNERPREARELLTMRRFLAEAFVPPGDSDLALDRTLVQEQLQWAALVAEPQRMATARAALDHFRQRYRDRYGAHHRAYWTEMARLHSRLLEASRQVAALSRLNSLSELGPPVGQGATVAYHQLLKETSGCPLIVGVEEELQESALCPACRLGMDQEPPLGQVNEVLGRIQRAIERQLARLSSTAIQQVLRRSGDARIEQFLKVVQAAQLAPMADLLDDELVGYLRRFLVEARISTVLEPILSRVAQGACPPEAEAQRAMQEVSRVLERALRAVQQALPPPSPPRG